MIIKNFLTYFINIIISIFRFFWIRINKNNRASQQPRNAIEILYEDEAKKAATYISKHLDVAQIFDNRFDHLKSAIRNSNTNGLILEFGVWNGKTFNIICSEIEKGLSKSTCYGFDSFEGLYQPWYGTHHGVGAFAVKHLPKTRQNGKLIVGKIEDTLKPFLNEMNEIISFMHIDTDTYESASYILRESIKFIKSGTVIVFDEYHGYPNYENGEFKAWKEFVKNYELSYQYIGFSLKQSSIRVL